MKEQPEPVHIRTYLHVQTLSGVLAVLYGLSAILSAVLSYKLPTQYLPLINTSTFYNQNTQTFEAVSNILNLYTPGRYIWILFAISFIIQLFTAIRVNYPLVLSMIERNTHYIIWFDVLICGSFIQYEIATRAGVTNVTEIWYQAFLMAIVGMLLILAEIGEEKARHIAMKFTKKDELSLIQKDGTHHDYEIISYQFKLPDSMFLGPYTVAGIVFLGTWISLFASINSTFGDLQPSISVAILLIFFLEMSYPILIWLKYYDIWPFEDYFYLFIFYNVFGLVIKFIIAWSPIRADVITGD